MSNISKVEVSIITTARSGPRLKTTGSQTVVNPGHILYSKSDSKTINKRTTLIKVSCKISIKCVVYADFIPVSV